MSGKGWDFMWFLHEKNEHFSTTDNSKCMPL